VLSAQVAGATTPGTYSFTGSEQTYTVPAGVTAVTITAIGAPGGEGPADTASSPEVGVYAGGKGASVTATVPVSPGGLPPEHGGGG
jgi:hypothetical protein